MAMITSEKMLKCVDFERPSQRQWKLWHMHENEYSVLNYDNEYYKIYSLGKCSYDTNFVLCYFLIIF